MIVRHAVCVGQRFLRWIVIGPTTPRNYKRRWLCRCDCGTVREVDQNELSAGKTRSCGCFAREIGGLLAEVVCTKHGQHKSPEYQAWQQMKDRCHNPRSRIFPAYGGRGITVCKEWRASFESFLRVVGPRPSPCHSLDRVDNDLGYYAGNVRWATATQQIRNRRNSAYLTVNGETRLLVEWAVVSSISLDCLRVRLRKGWPPERTLSAARPWHRRLGGQ